MNGRPRVAYQGAPGAFGEEAIARYWGGRADPVEEPTFEDVVSAVARGETRYGVLPVWNSTIGRIDAAWAALAPPSPGASRGIRTAGELTLHVRHYLLALPGVRPSTITAVVSHPASIAQCARFIGERKLRALPATDSAAAARALSQAQHDEPFVVPGTSTMLDPRATAVIAPAAAAARYQLAILACSVQNEPDNRTSFLVVEGGVTDGGARW